MKNIYETASDKHVRATKVYVKETPDKYCYAEEAFTNKVDSDTLKNMFVMGTAVIVDGGVEYRPVSFKVTSDVVSLTYVKTDGTTATTAVLAVVNGKEYVEPVVEGSEG